MIYLRYAICAVLVIALDLLSRCFFNWLVVLFCDEDGNLPRWCYYWQTFDNTCDEGMNCARAEILAGVGGVWKDFDPYPPTKFARYMNRVQWLNRNCCYGFEYFVFGIPWVKADWTVTTFVNTPERTKFVAWSKQGHFNLYYHGKFGMYKLGWKAWNLNDMQGGFTDSNGMGGKGRIPIVVSANPFKTKQAA